jgi:uncharacterized protein YabN with tetrapyrrole methylase and pyrophosphatase domain
MNQNILESLIALEKKAQDFGFNWPDHTMILDQIISECQEIKEEILHAHDPHKLQEEIGDLLHAAISLCLFSGFSVNETLGKTIEKFNWRMNFLRDLAHKKGLQNLRGQKASDMMELWKEVKASERHKP